MEPRSTAPGRVATPRSEARPDRATPARLGGRGPQALRTPQAGALAALAALALAGCTGDARELQQELSRYAQLFMGVFGLFMAIRAFRRRNRLPRADAKFGRYRRPTKPPS